MKLKKVLETTGCKDSYRNSDKLTHIILLMIIITSTMFLIIYVMFIPFAPAIAVHVVYIIYNIHLIRVLPSGRRLYVKQAMFATYLIQLSLAVFLWFPGTTHYSLYYLLMPMAAYSLVDFESVWDVRLAHVWAVLPSILFFVSEILNVNFFIYQTRPQVDLLLSLITSGSVLSALVFIFAHHANNQNLHRKDLEKLANTDSLTKIRNRRVLFKDGVDEFNLAKKYGHELTLILMDVDHFKSFNDKFGHPAGDEVLIGLAKTVSRNIRKDDTFFRYGGEEFALLIRRSSFKNSIVIAEKLLEKIRNEEHSIGENLLKITVSIGLAQYSTDYVNFDDMVKAADKALYKAKNNGRNRVEFN